jgi:hypothetical protein
MNAQDADIDGYHARKPKRSLLSVQSAKARIGISLEELIQLLLMELQKIEFEGIELGNER